MNVARQDSPEPSDTRSQASEPRSYVANIFAAGAAAAVVAVLTSYAGVQGTVLGAALGAMTATVVSQVMKTPLGAIEGRLIAAGFSAWRLRRDGLLRGILVTPGAPLKLLRAVPRRAVISVSVLAVAGFSVGMTGVSALELIQGRPLSASAAEAPPAETTLGTIVRPALSNVPAAAPTDTPAEEAEPGVEPAPTTGPSAVEPTARVPTAAATQATAAPSPTSPRGGQATAAPTASPTRTVTPATGAPAKTQATATPTSTLRPAPTSGPQVTGSPTPLPR